MHAHRCPYLYMLIPLSLYPLEAKVVYHWYCLLLAPSGLTVTHLITLFLFSVLAFRQKTDLKEVRGHRVQHPLFGEDEEGHVEEKGVHYCTQQCGLEPRAAFLSPRHLYGA